MVVADFSRPGGIKLPTQIDTTRGKREIYQFIYLFIIIWVSWPFNLTNHNMWYRNNYSTDDAVNLITSLKRDQRYDQVLLKWHLLFNSLYESLVRVVFVRHANKHTMTAEVAVQWSESVSNLLECFLSTLASIFCNLLQSAESGSLFHFLHCFSCKEAWHNSSS